MRNSRSILSSESHRVTTETISQTKTRVRLPQMWHVILHNDDFTPFEFVAMVLIRVFHKSPEEAIHITQTVHNKGRATVGLYTREVAETKVATVTAMAQRAEHPLLTTAEPA